MSSLYTEGLGLLADVRPLLSPIARKDHDLTRRLKRACDDVPEHLAEAMCVTGRARKLEYEGAAKALREALGCVRAAEGAGYLPQSNEELTERMESLLLRLRDALENSGVFPLRPAV